ncbi:MAG TPA: hypothetical protein VFF77_02330 [Holophagaceae bacterium]|nr:hypothetical protein [Holophagaceae bacterium]
MNDADTLEPSPEEATITHVRASLLRGLHKDMARRGGTAWDDLVDGLSPMGRETFRSMPGSFIWLEAARVSELVLAHTALAGEAGAVERIRATAEEQLTVVHAWLLKLLSPKTLIQQGPTIFKFNYRGGVVRLDGIEPGRAHLSIWALGLFPEWYTHSVPQWLKRALELSGGGACAAIHEPPPGSGYRHRYELTWER